MHVSTVANLPESVVFVDDFVSDPDVDVEVVVEVVVEEMMSPMHTIQLCKHVYNYCI